MCCVHRGASCSADCLYWLFLQLLEERQSVLAEDEVDLWKCATGDLMSDEEDSGASGWIVRPPPFHSRELTELYVTLQSRLEAIQKCRATHHRHLQNGPNSDGRPPVTYSSEAANRHLTVLLCKYLCVCANKFLFLNKQHVGAQLWQICQKSQVIFLV